jgi:hypothetical protein
VPKKGLEPPHPCGYMDLNHARLPIPPLRPVTGFAEQPHGLPVRKNYSSILQTHSRLSNFLSCQDLQAAYSEHCSDRRYSTQHLKK